MTNQAITLETEIKSVGIRATWTLFWTLVARTLNWVDTSSLIIDRTVNLANIEHKKFCEEYSSTPPTN